ncbi:MAG: IS91 family transposase [Candidatus Promineifilaceae bacterium]
MSNYSEASPTAVETDNSPHFEVADIFRLYGDEFRRQYSLSYQQHLVMRDIGQCRTAILGGHVDECDNCGGLRVSYNSCRNRHCPKCGSLAKAQWLEKQRTYLLPVHYFHVVFTLDHDLNPLIRVNQKLLYDLLFQTATDTLKQICCEELGGEIGMTAILHTWGQTLTEHPHLHCLVPGGALSANGRRWRATSPSYLCDVVALAARFRDAFCAGLSQLYAASRLQFSGQSHHLADADAFANLLAEARSKKWQVYAQPPFGQPEQVLDYLGRYVHRIAFSNGRLLAISDGQVRFTYRDYQANGQQKEMVLPAVEFIRRFLQHVLPKQYVRVRHYGFLAPRYRQQKLARCRTLLGDSEENAAPTSDREAILRQMLGHDPNQCPLCGVGSWRPYQTIEPHPRRRRWLAAVQ